MLLNVDGIVKRLQSKLDNPAGDWADKDYLLGYINDAWDDLYIRLAALGLDYAEVVQEITVPANTSSLADFQKEGQPLESIMAPVKLEWKLATDPSTEYGKHEIRYTEELPDRSGDVEGHSFYEWRGGVIFVQASAIETMIRVRFKAYSVDFLDPTDDVIRGAGNILAWKAAELVNAPNARNNAAACTYCRTKAEEACEDFEVLSIKQKQKQLKRFGRTRRVLLRPTSVIMAPTPNGVAMGTRHSPDNQPDGVLTSFTFTALPNNPAWYQVYVNGLLTTSGFTQLGQTLTFAAPLAAGTELYAYY